MRGTGTQARVTPEGAAGSIRVMISKVRHGASAASAIRDDLGSPATSAPAESPSPCFRKLRRFMAPPCANRLAAAFRVGISVSGFAPTQIGSDDGSTSPDRKPRSGGGGGRGLFEERQEGLGERRAAAIAVCHQVEGARDAEVADGHAAE